ncbi:MAG: hypothetical protein QM589_04985 [Thermomicrobiales bacterium]
MTALPKTEIRNLRPSIVIAEALVDRQQPAEIVDRARELGFSRDLTEAVVHVCCRGTHAGESCVSQNTSSCMETAISAD